MATGPEHYLKAITSLPLIHEETDGAWAIARAVESLTHAVLAVAAAMGTYGVADETRTAADANAWEYAAGEYTEQRRQARRDKAEGDAEAKYVAGITTSPRPVEHVDYAEAKDVRQIEREMDRDAGDDSEIDRQVAEDDARNEREYETHQANEAWLDAHPDEFVNDEDEDGAL
jgi:hypothetical protein